MTDKLSTIKLIEVIKLVTEVCADEQHSRCDNQTDCECRCHA